ncbi:MAG: hypothetical protein WA865_17410, partial [Spirulinaceae cyanobacterium]
MPKRIHRPSSSNRASQQKDSYLSQFPNDSAKSSSPQIPKQVEIENEAFNQNKFEKLALSFMGDKIGREPEARELAAVIMYWQTMVSRYEKNF